jgi:hypothetical protein
VWCLVLRVSYRDRELMLADRGLAVDMRTQAIFIAGLFGTAA